MELGVVIGRGGANIKTAHAADHIAGYCLALDVTARDLQVGIRHAPRAHAKQAARRAAKEEGRPWSVAKGFDTFCPVSAYLNRAAIYDHQEVDMWLKVNGQLRQKGNTRDMIFG